MVKHTQTIRRQQPANCLSVFDLFVELSLKELNYGIIYPKLLRKKAISEFLSKSLKNTRLRDHFAQNLQRFDIQLLALSQP